MIILYDIKSGIQRAQTLQNIPIPRHLQFFSRVSLGRTRETLFLTGINSSHDHILKRLDIFFQHHVNRILPHVLDLPSHHTDERKKQRKLFRGIRNRKLVISLGICYRPQTKSFYQNRYPGKWLLFLVHNFPFHGNSSHLFIIVSIQPHHNHIPVKQVRQASILKDRSQHVLYRLIIYLQGNTSHLFYLFDIKKKIKIRLPLNLVKQCLYTHILHIQTHPHLLCQAIG